MAGRLLLFGGGGALPSAHRDSTWLAFHQDGSRCLLDCGGSPVWRLERAGFPWQELDLVLITHSHVDHCYGLPALLQSLLLAGRSRPLPLYCPPEEQEWLQGLIRIHQLDQELELPIRGLLSGQAVSVGSDGTQLEVFATRHSRPCLGAILRGPRGPSLVYTSDTSPLEAWPDAARRACLLVHEASFPDQQAELAHQIGHSTPSDGAGAAEELEAEALALVHLGPDQDPTEMVRQAQGSLSHDIPVTVPEDGATIWTGTIGSIDLSG